jgi:hypothetical protein
MILFGWNNYRLTSVQPHELGVQASANADMSIEYRQKYFHLFFIPVFPLGKFWAVRQAGQLYEPSAQLRERLESMQLRSKNGIWAWTGILLAVAVSFFYNISSKLDHIAYQKESAANSAVLAAFFKNEKKTAPLASKMHAINYFTDSCINDEAYEKKKIDTSMGPMLKLYMTVFASQRDSLVGYNRKNTLVFSYINHKKDKSYLPDDNIKKALEDGEWKGYADTASVFGSLQQLKDYKYLLVLKEINRFNPTVQKEGFSSGVSLADAAIINIDDRKIEHRFRVIAANSDSVSHFSFRRRGESGSMAPHEWLNVLESDLNGNVVKKASKYVFRDESVAIGPRRY